jgi:hypothetical protein
MWRVEQTPYPMSKFKAMEMCKTEDRTAGIWDNDRIRHHNTVLSHFHLACSSLAETTGTKAECGSGHEIICISHSLAYFQLSYIHLTPWAKLWIVTSCLIISGTWISQLTFGATIGALTQGGRSDPSFTCGIRAISRAKHSLPSNGH